MKIKAKGLPFFATPGWPRGGRWPAGVPPATRPRRPGPPRSARPCRGCWHCPAGDGSLPAALWPWPNLSRVGQWELQPPTVTRLKGSPRTRANCHRVLKTIWGENYDPVTGNLLPKGREHPDVLRNCTRMHAMSASCCSAVSHQLKSDFDTFNKSM